MGERRATRAILIYRPEFGAGLLLSHLESGPVPRRIPVCWPLQVAKLDLIGGIHAPSLHREFHFQELVSLVPLHLKSRQ